jgi:hypothetical protein
MINSYKELIDRLSKSTNIPSLDEIFEFLSIKATDEEVSKFVIECKSVCNRPELWMYAQSEIQSRHFKKLISSSNTLEKLTQELIDFGAKTEKYTKKLIVLTWAIVFLTLILVAKELGCFDSFFPKYNSGSMEPVGINTQTNRTNQNNNQSNTIDQSAQIKVSDSLSRFLDSNKNLMSVSDSTKKTKDKKQPTKTSP